MSGLKCAFCGAENPADRSHCRLCGSALDRVSRPGGGAPVELPDWLTEVLPDSAWDEPAETEEWTEAIEEEPHPATPQPPRHGGTAELIGVPERLAGRDLPEWMEREGAEDSEAALEELDASQRPDRPAGEKVTSRERLSYLRRAGARSAEPPEAPMPAWLKALPDRRKGPAEKSGPLAGLPGVIAIVPEAVRPRPGGAPAPFSLTQEQSRQVALLQELAEAAPPPSLVERAAPAPPALRPRLLLAALLLAAVLVGRYAPNLTAAPAVADLPVPAPAQRAHEALMAAAGRPVLVAFDYSPAWAAELEPAALALLRQLAANRSPAIRLSQSAAGLTIGADLMAQVEGLESYSLGFLPGEAAGLRQLGGCLEAGRGCDNLAALPLSPELQAQLDQVALVVVLTGERDALVNWVEQVGRRGMMPLAAGLTQALAPLAQPYYRSGQLAGIIAGAPAALAYAESLAHQSAAGQGLLASLGLAQTLAVGVMLAGGVYFGLAGAAGPLRMRP
ncbi:MAG: hypothetical protein ACRDHL_01640 [Candidatus Promineifilaceae bacterium]